MELRVLAVPECPNVDLLLERLRQVLPDPDSPVPVHVVTDEAEAERLGMHGSPTLLVDGVDLFSAPGAAATVSCRIYRGTDGRAGGAPGIEQLRDALIRASRVATSGD